MNTGQTSCTSQAAHDATSAGFAAAAPAFGGGVQGSDRDTVQDGGVVR